MSRVDQQLNERFERATLAKVDSSSAKGQAAGRYHVRRLCGDDLAELFVLHRKIIDCLPEPELYLPKDEQYFKLRLDGEFASSTFILGAFFEGTMIAYSSVRFVSHSAEAPALVVTPAPPWRNLTIAMMEDAAVDPNHRGRGIQALLNRAKADIARQAGAGLHVALVDAKNFPSLRNLLGERFAAIGTARAANGLIRLVLARLADSPQTKPAVCDPPVSDCSEIAEMFLRGYVGVDVREIDGPERAVGIIFTRPST